MFSHQETKVFTKPKPEMVNIYVTKQRHPQSWFKRGDCYLLYKHDGFFSNMPDVDACKLGAARVIMADQCEEL